MSDWIDWPGGACPVAPDDAVDLRWRDGDCEINERAGDHEWQHKGGSDDILAYRPLRVTDEDRKATEDAERMLLKLKLADTIIISDMEMPSYERASAALHERLGRAFSARHHPGRLPRWELQRLPDTGNIAAAAVKGGARVSEPIYTEFEKGERQALLEVRSFVTKHGTKEVDAYCMQRLHDIRMDNLHAAKKAPATAS